jgi:chromosome partitioning protein
MKSLRIDDASCKPERPPGKVRCINLLTDVTGAVLRGEWKQIVTLDKFSYSVAQHELTFRVRVNSEASSSMTATTFSWNTVEKLLAPMARHRKKKAGVLSSYQELRQIFESHGYVYPRKNISFQIVKGGTGKTSLSYSLASRAHHYGAKVLCVDFDQQGNLTRSFNVQARDKYVWINLFRDRVKAENAIVSIAPGLDLIPSNLNNSRLDVELSGAASNLRDMIRDKLAPIRDGYDLVVMDCPPAINKINTAITCASDLVIIPINPDPYAMDGMEFTLSELERVREDFKLNCDCRLIWNRFDGRERLGAFYVQELSRELKNSAKLFPVVIRADVSVKNAVFDAKSVFETTQKSAFREDIDQFTREVLGLNDFKAGEEKEPNAVRRRSKTSRKEKNEGKNTKI